MADNANTVFADGPPGAPSQPDKARIRAWGTWLESFLTAIGANSGSVYTTRALLFADLAHPANAMAWVVQDATAAYNGIYLKSGASGAGAWTRVGDLPYSFVAATDGGSGGANAIVATTSVPVSESALIITNVFRANTGSPVTIAFNGGPALTVKTNSGNSISPGGLLAGMRLLGTISGSEFRLVSDQVSSAIVAAAEGSAAAALASKNAAATSEGNASDSAALANEFANNPEDAEVVLGSGLFSAYHWAMKAAAVVTGGIAAAIHAAVAKTTLADNDEWGIADSAAGWILKRVTWLTIKLQTLVFPYVSLASAGTTCDIGAASSKNINITGTTGITAFPSAPAGTERWLKFAAALTLTYNGASLLLPGAVNLTVAAGDKIRAVSLGGGNWELSQYEAAAVAPPTKPPFVSSQQTYANQSAISVAHGLGAQPKRLRARFVNITTEGGWVPGNEIHFTTYWGFNGAQIRGCTLSADATNVVLSIYTLTLINKAGTSDITSTPANWRIILEAEL